jgi:hypothetical protein
MKRKMYFSLLMGVLVCFTPAIAQKADGWNVVTQFLKGKKAPETVSFKKANFLRTETVNLQWDEVVNQYDSTTKSVFAYDNAGRVSIETLQRFSNSTWEDTYRNSFTYDNQGRTIVTFVEYFNTMTSAWENSRLDSSFYDQNGSLVENKFYSWNSSSNIWNLGFAYKDVYTYNQQGRALTQISVLYSSFSNDWDTVSRMDYTYNSTTGKLTQLDFYSYDSSSWNQVMKFINVELLDEDFEKPLKFTMQVNAMGQWINYSRGTFTYNANKDVTSELTERFMFAWVPKDKTTYTYDNKNNLTYTYEMEWSNNAWDTVDIERIDYAYDQNGNMHTEEYLYWDSSTNDWDKDQMNIHRYLNITSARKNLSLSSVKVFPNPVADILNIENSEKAEIKLFDSAGKVVLKQENVQHTQLNISDLQTGIYFLTVKSATSSETFKIVKQ